MGALHLLEGVRVIEFTHVWAGPFCGQVLADLGAEVIKVESSRHVDVHRRAGPYPQGRGGINRSGVWNAQNRGKRGCVLNLKTERGVELALRLVARADTVVENFAPGALDRRGLSFAAMQRFNPRIVLVSLTGYGVDGPWRTYPAYGPMLDAVGGLAAATRSAVGAPQSVNGWFPDTSAALYGALAAVTGIASARATGRGAHYDIAELEATMSLLPEAVALAALGLSADETEWLVAGVFPCREPDTWVWLSVADAQELAALFEAFGVTVSPSAKPGEVARAIGQELQRFTPDDAARCGQAVGVEIVPVMSARDLLDDEHLKARDAFQVIEHPEAGPLRVYAPVLRRPGWPPAADRPAPNLGQDNEYVFTELLGLSTDEVTSLVADGVIV